MDFVNIFPIQAKINSKKDSSIAIHLSELYLSKQFLSTLFLNPVIEKEDIEITSDFHSGKAAGCDNIPMSIIQENY